MKTIFKYLFAIAAIVIMFSACKKDDDNNDTPPETTYYTVTYSFGIEVGNYENLNIQYMDKDQQIQSVDSPALPWEMKIDKFEEGKTIKLVVNFTAKPSDTLSYAGEAKYEGTDGSIDIKQCAQKLTGLSADVPINCTNETIIK